MYDLIARGVMEVTGDASGLVAEMARGQAAVDAFAKKSTTAAAQASSALAGSGKGAAEGVNAMDAASKRYVASLEREINSLTMSRAEYRKWEAQVKGISESVYAPLVKRLDEARRAQDALGAGGKTAANNLGLVGVSAGQVSAAMRTLPAQFTDIATQLAGGGSPFLILLQQGGQIKDQFGGISNSLKALGSLITPSVALFGGLAAGVGAAALALYSGASDAKELARSLILTSNAAGTTAGQFSALTKSIADNSQRSIGSIREIGLELIKTGAIGPTVFASVTKAAERYADATGMTAQQSAAAFAKMAADPLKFAQDLNRTYGFLTYSQQQYIKSLQEQGRLQDATGAVSDALNTHLQKLDGSLGSIDKILKAGKNAWGDYWEAAKGYGKPATVEDEIDTLTKKILAARQAQSAAPGIGAADINAFSGKPTLAGKDSLDPLLEQRRFLNRKQSQQASTAAADAVSAAASKAASEIAPDLDKARSLLEMMNKDVDQFRAKAAAVRLGITDPDELAKFDALAAKTENFIRATSAAGQQAYAIQIANIEGSLSMASLKLSGLQDQLESASMRGLLSQRQYVEQTAQIQEDALRAEIAALDAKRKVEAGKPNNKQGVDAVDIQLRLKTQELLQREQRLREDLIMVQAREAGQVVDLVQAFRQEELAQQKATDGAFVQQRAAMAESIQAQSRALAISGELLDKEASLIGATDQQRQIAIEHLRIEIAYRQKLREIGALTFSDITDGSGNVVKSGAQQRQDMIDAALKNKTEEQAQVTTKIYADAWSKINADISSGLADAIMSGGKSGADYLKSLFKSMVLKPVIQTALAPVSAGISAFLNPAAAAAATANGTAGAGTSTGLAAGALFGAGGLSGSLLAGAGWMTGATTLTGSLSAAASLIGTGTAGGILSGLSMAAGALGPIAIGIAALASLDTKATPHVGGYVLADSKGGITDITKQQGGIQQADTQSAIGVLAKQLSTTLAAGSEAFGQAASSSIRAVFEADGKDAAWGLFHILDSAGKQQAGSFDALGTLPADAAKGFEQFSQQAAIAVRDSLLAIDLPKWASDALNKITASDGADALVTVVQNIAETQKAISAFGKQFDGLGGLFAKIAGLSSDATFALGQAAGGLDALTTGLTTYYGAFYTEAERAAMSMSQITAQLADVGLAMPATREAFRKLVDAQDLTTESGQKTFAALMGVAGAFDQVITSADASAQAFSSAYDAMVAKFQTPDQATAYKYNGIAASLSKVGVNVDAATLIGASKDSILAFVDSFVTLTGVTNDAKIAVINAAGALADLKTTATSTASDVGIGGRKTSGADYQKWLATYNSITPAQMDAYIGAYVDRIKSTSYAYTASPNNPGADALWAQDMPTFMQVAKGPQYALLAQSLADQLMQSKVTPGTAWGGDQMGSIVSSTDNLAQPQLDATKALIESLDSLESSLSNYLDSLTQGDLSTLSPEAKYAEAKAAFDSISRQAQAGDQAAAERLQSAAQTLLQSSRSYNASGSAYAMDFSDVVAALQTTNARLQAIEDQTRNGNAIAADVGLQTIDAVSAGSAAALRTARTAELERQRANA